MQTLRDVLINTDVSWGRALSLKLPAYIEEDILTEGAGVYTAEEWSRTRSLGYRDAGVGSAELDSDETYLTRIFSKHRRNVLAALRLMDSFDFSRYGSILELGSGEMIQAFVIKSAFPQVRYRATDFDPYIVAKCEKLGILRGLEKSVVDAKRLTAETLAGVNLLISWEMNYALSDQELLVIMRAAKAAKVPYLACGTQHLGPIRYLLRRLKNLNWRPGGFYYQRLLNQNRLRMHGWQMSLGYYRNLAAQAGMTLSRVVVPPVSRLPEDNYVYCLLTP